jgi:penicillin-binding protein 1A
VAKKPSRSRKLSVYSNLSKHRKTSRELASRQRAEYRAKLPKDPVKRFLYRLHPKNFWAYWFSKQGLYMALKITGVALLVICLMVGALFAYFRKDLDSINPDELSKRVQTTVTKYYDRNGNLLWEDTGGGDYKLVVPSSDLNKYLKYATVAIEDKDFYKHGGVSLTGIARAALTDIQGGQVQGGSTLTQQLVKQVFFADEAGNRGLSGIPRKIKEVILAFEVERMYTKDQIISMYLNESPYGGPRNGVESGAETYFGVSAKNVTLPEAALLAAIPQNPSVFNPYNTAGNADLIARQHTVLDKMAQQGYITQKEADDAKKSPIIDSLKPESDQFHNMQAPWFVQMVRQELISKLGASVVGRGGLTVKTTLDIRIQNKLEESMKNMFDSYIPNWAGFTDAASTIEDTQTGQILALMGSRSWDYPGFGETNAATSYIQPGSSIKPLVYAQLFQQKPAGQQNYGSGSLFDDTSNAAVQALYGAPLSDADGKSKGMMTVRNSLAQSRNIPAVLAMYVNGVKPTLDEIHAMGANSYCTQGADTQAGLAAAIGGCGLRQVDLVNAYSSLARGGVYKPQSDVLSVTNSSGETLMKWTDTSGTRVIDQQSAYIVSDILNDDVARRPLDGYHAKGMWFPNIQTATKTGTSDKNGFAKDIWMMSYSPVVAMGVWFGNPDTSILKNGTSSLPGAIIADVMPYIHQDIYQPAGKWKSNQWFTQPAGIQKIGNELYPSWWNKNQGVANSNMDFDQVSKRAATQCTPATAKVSLGVTRTTDPITKKEVVISPTGYDAAQQDNVHVNSDGSCITATPTIASMTISPSNSGKGPFTITMTVIQGAPQFNVTGVQVNVGSTSIAATNTSGNTWVATYTPDSNITGNQPVTAVASDSGLYKSSGGANSSITVTGGNGNQ